MVKQHHSPSVCYYIGEGAPYYGVITYHYYMLKKLGSNSFVFIYLFLFYLFIWILVWVCDDDGCGYGGGDRFLGGVVATTFFLFLAMGLICGWRERRERHCYEVRVTMRKRVKWIKNEQCLVWCEK